MNETSLKTVTPNAAPAQQQTTANFMFNLESMAQIESFAQMMAKGTSTIPQHLQKNPADCAAIVIQSLAWNMIPYAVAQKTHIINGTLGYEAQLINAVITSMAPTRDRLHFEWFGPWPAFLKDTSQRAKELDCGVRVWATMKGEDSPRILELEMNQATIRNSPLWKSDPKQQLAYLATKKWARLYCPDVIMGVYTPEDLSQPPMKDITPTDSVEALLESRPEPEPEPDSMDTRIQNFLNAISGAQNLNRLKTIGNQLKAAEKEIQQAVRAAYTGKLEEFRPKDVDISTGEIAEKIETSHLRKLIETAPDVETLTECREMVGRIDKRTADYKDLTGLIDVRKNEIQNDG